MRSLRPTGEMQVALQKEWAGWGWEAGAQTPSQASPQQHPPLRKFWNAMESESPFLSFSHPPQLLQTPATPATHSWLFILYSGALITFQFWRHMYLLHIYEVRWAVLIHIDNLWWANPDNWQPIPSNIHHFFVLGMITVLSSSCFEIGGGSLSTQSPTVLQVPLPS